MKFLKLLYCLFFLFGFFSNPTQASIFSRLNKANIEKSQQNISPTSMRKAMNNPDIPSNRLDDIVNSFSREWRKVLGLPSTLKGATGIKSLFFNNKMDIEVVNITQMTIIK